MRKIVSISVVIVILAMFLLIGTTQGTDQETLIKRIKENYFLNNFVLRRVDLLVVYLHSILDSFPFVWQRMYYLD